MTTTDFPPFNFIDRKKRLTGFHIDLAREICEVLDVLARCQIQALPWAELIPSIEKGDGEAIIAGVSVSRDTRKKLTFSHHYMQIPARFVIHRQSGLAPPAYEALFRKTVGIVEGSAHEAYFQRFFANRSHKPFKTRDEALKALQANEVDAVFSDALSLSFWLTSPNAKDCCSFLDGAFSSPELFGNGLAVAVGKDNDKLVDMINFALSEINANGKFEELYLRYFPLGLF